MDRHMQCEGARESADAFVAGELGPESTEDILHHLESCSICRADIAARRGLREQLRGAFLASGALAPRLAWTHDVAERLKPATASAPTTVRGWWTGGFALAATLLLGASVAIYFGAGVRGAAALAELARLAVGDHRNCAIKFALAERPIPLAEAATRYDAAYRALERAPADSFVARGGTVEVVERHSCVYDGHRFAHVVMRYQGQIVSLLITTEPVGVLRRLASPSAGTSVALATSDGSVVSAGRAGGHVVFVVSDGGSELVRDVADAVSPAVYAALFGA